MHESPVAPWNGMISASETISRRKEGHTVALIGKLMHTQDRKTVELEGGGENTLIAVVIFRNPVE